MLSTDDTVQIRGAGGAGIFSEKRSGASGPDSFADPWGASPFFPPEELNAVLSIGVVRVYPKNTILINEQSQSGWLYILLSGRAKSYVSDGSGKELILGIQGPGQYFGETESVDAGLYLTSVMTLEPSRICVISGNSFRLCLLEHPEVLFTLLHSMTHKIRLLTESVKNLALNDVYGRVVSTLLSLASEHCGARVIQERLTQEELAHMVGASREMVSRILKELRVGGYIKIEDRKITILKSLPSGW
jgi:CRP/FNR family transcriptional regulator, cyclic AMP receptor protein